MSRPDLVSQVMRGIGEDLHGYRELEDLLEQQFQAALHYRSEQLNELVLKIVGRVADLDQRRARRVALVVRLHGEGAGMETLIAAVQPPRRELLATGWKSLEILVRRCKQLNVRNCLLLTCQHDTLQRVLHGEVDTYAPC